MSTEYKESWTMFRGNMKRTGTTKTKPIIKPLLYWTIELGPVISSPVFEGGFMYVGTLTGRVFCLDIIKREIKWHYNIGSPIVSSPIILNEKLICATFDSWINNDISKNNSIFSLDKNDGSMGWKLQISADIFSSPCGVGKNIVLGSMDRNLYFLDERGEIIWKYETNGQVWSSPSYYDNSIYFGSDDGFIYSVNSDGLLRWKSKLNGKVRSSSPCLSENLIFIGTHEGGIYCLSSIDGTIKWSKTVLRPVLSSPLLIRDKIIFGSSDNKIYCFNLKGSKSWEFETSGKIWSSPSTSEYDSLLFFGSLDSFIYGIDSHTGKQEWKFPTMGSIDSSPCLSDGMLFVGSRDGIMYCFERYRQATYIR